MKKFLLMVVGLAAFLLLGFTLYSTFAYRTPRPYPETVIVVEPGTGARAVLAQLHAQGLTPPLPLMALPVVISHQYQRLKAGEYHFMPGLTPAQIIGQIARGEVVVHKLTVPEGWNRFQVRDALLREPLLTGELPVIAEGSVFPDTMHFARGEARAAVLVRMQKKRDDMLAQLWAGRAENLPLHTPEEALILASVVEKETGVADERTKVAAVFINRLRMGMRLQSDPTVVYGIEVARDGQPMGRELTRNDVLRDTPYNSYTRDGLPPGPICNPGRASLEAVLHPADITALYFVATGHGGHRFADTMQAHEENVVEYRKVIRPAAEQVKKPVVSKSKRKRR